MKKLLFLLLLLPFIGSSQEKKKDKWGWRTITTVGMISGEQGTKELLQLSGGVTYDRFYVGAGAGYDPYVIRTIPIFADLRYDALKSKAGFVYANLGFSKILDDDEQPGFLQSKNETNGKFYFDIGAGYKIRLGGMHKLIFSAGYSQKEVRVEKEYLSPCWMLPCNEPEPSIFVYDYTFGRIIIKLAWELGR